MRWAVRVFGWVQRVLPKGYRERHGRDAEGLFRELVRDGYERRGIGGVVFVLAGSVLDLARRAPLEHIAGEGGWKQAGGWWRSGPWNAGWEFRQAIRTVRREPVPALIIILTLGLAMGAMTAIAGVADAALLRPLPYGDADGIYRLVTTYSGERTDASVSYPDFLDVGAGVPALAESAVAYDHWSATLSGDGEPSVESGLLVTSSFFSLMRLKPALGRFFAPAEDRDGQDAVVVLGYGLWQRRFGGARDVVGRTIEVDGSPHVIVGVGPAAFPDELPAVGRASIYRPLGYDGAPADAVPSRGNESFTALVRLKPGATAAQVDTGIARVMAANARAYPRSNTGQGMRLEPLREAVVGAARPALRVFMVAAVVVLLVALTNVVNLMVARTANRRQELALRSALGAGRGRLSILLLAEALVLALSGGAAGLGLAVVLTRLLVVRGGGAIPLGETVAMDGRVLAFMGLLCLAVGVVTGLASGLDATRGPLNRVLLESGTGQHGATAGSGASRLRRALVVAQVALCVTLMVTASLLLRTLDALVRVDPGFDTRVTTFRLSAPDGRYPEDPDLTTFYARVVESVAGVPGVEDVATVGATPLSTVRVCGTLFAAEDPHRFAGQDMCAEVRPISPEYFAVMGIPLRAGRAFTEADGSLATDVGIVSESTAALLWPGEDPIGRRFATGLNTDEGPRLFEVVGVVPDVKQFRLDEKTPPQTYVPSAQWPVRGRSVVLRSAVPAATLFPALRAAVWSVDDRVPLSGLGTLFDDVQRTLVTPRFRTVLLGSCALLALSLAVVGLYGVIAGSVSGRRNELAIRMSVGARPAGILLMVLLEGTRLVLFGIAIGMVAAIATSRLLRGMLFGVSALDPLSLAAAPLIVLATATIACLLPAARATAVDPVASLRQ